MLVWEVLRGSEVGLVILRGSKSVLVFKTGFSATGVFDLSADVAPGISAGLVCDLGLERGTLLDSASGFGSVAGSEDRLGVW